MLELDSRPVREIVRPLEEVGGVPVGAPPWRRSEPHGLVTMHDLLDRLFPAK